MTAPRTFKGSGPRPDPAQLAELFVYAGDRHLFADSSLPSYDADAAALVVQRSRRLLERVDETARAGR